MILAITDNRVKDTEAYLPLAKAFATDAMKDQGCHGMEVFTDPEKQDRVVFVSRWDAKEDFMSHVQGATFAKHLSGMGPYYVSGTDTFLKLVK